MCPYPDQPLVWLPPENWLCMNIPITFMSSSQGFGLELRLRIMSWSWSSSGLVHPRGLAVCMMVCSPHRAVPLGPDSLPLVSGSLLKISQSAVVLKYFGWSPSLLLSKIWSAGCMCYSVNRNLRTGTNPFVISSPFRPTFPFSSANNPFPSILYKDVRCCNLQYLILSYCAKQPLTIFQLQKIIK